MRTLTALTLLMLLGLGFDPASADSARDILGTWAYDGFQYDGNRYPKPNPDLTLTFTFQADGTDRLYWNRANEGITCERTAEYSILEGHLMQKIVWVNPQNPRDCDSDPDMKMGLETDTAFTILGDELWLHLELNGKPFYYILKISSRDNSI